MKVNAQLISWPFSFGSSCLEKGWLNLEEKNSNIPLYLNTITWEFLDASDVISFSPEVWMSAFSELFMELSIEDCEFCSSEVSARVDLFKKLNQLEIRTSKPFYIPTLNTNRSFIQA